MDRRVKGRLSVDVGCVFSTDLGREPMEVGWGAGMDGKSQFSEQIRHSQKFHTACKRH